MTRMMIDTLFQVIYVYCCVLCETVFTVCRCGVFLGESERERVKEGRNEGTNE